MVGFLWPTTLIARFCSPEGEATSQFCCMKTMLWWKSHRQLRVRVEGMVLMCDLRQTTGFQHVRRHN